MVAALLLYAPGVFFFRALGFSWLLAGICAPLYSLAAYSVLPIAYYPLGISCTIATMVCPTLVIALAAYIVSPKRKHPRTQAIDIARARKIILFGHSMPFEPIALTGYIVIGLAMCVVVFGSGSLAVEGYLCNWDNQTHINLIRSFLDSGKWSSLHPSLYLASDPNAIPVTSTGKFYPSAIHDLIALICLITGGSIVTMYNATVAVLLVFAFPSCAYLFFAALFPRQRSVIASGAAVFMAFGVFPWAPVLFMGPMIPFLLGTTYALAVIAVVIAMITTKTVRSNLGGLIAFGCISAVSLALTQTSSLFTAYLFLGAYACHLLSASIAASKRISDERKLLVRVVAVIGLALILALVLVVCYHLPFMKSVVNYPTRKYLSLKNTLIRLFSLALTIGKPQILLALLTGVGLFGCYKKRMLWLIVPVGYMFLAYIGVSTQSGPLHSLDKLAGFWYNNYHRIAIHYALYLMPISAIGLSYAAKWATAAIGRLRHEPFEENARVALSGVIMAVLLIATLPVSGAGMYARIHDRAVAKLAMEENRVYAESETAFVKRAMEIIPSDALVLNVPYDGSVFCYGVDGMNTYIRKLEPDKLTDDAKLISSSLAEYAKNDDVRKAVEHVGASYVLLLDQGVPYEDGKWITKASKKMYQTWSNMNLITDDTPGFEVVLADGDMRLYRIV